MRKATLHRPINHVLATGVALGAICAHALAQVPCQYEVTLFCGPECDELFPAPVPVTRGISAAADIVGYYTWCNVGPRLAFMWNEQTGLQTLATLPGFQEARAYDLIDAGFIVGTMRFDETNHAILWQQGVPIDLGIPPGGDSANALAVNSEGKITGYWGSTVKGGWQAFLWDGEMIDLSGDFPTEDSRAFDVNEHTQLTGRMGSSPQVDARAFIWDSGRVTELPPIPGGYTSEGLALNDRGEVVGFGRMRSDDRPGSVRRAYYWSEGTALNLGTLPGCEISFAHDINNDGTVVGYCREPDLIAFVWKDGVMRALDDLVPPDLMLDVHRAFGINEAGHIAAFGADKNLNGVAMLLTPVEPPLGDLDGDCQVGVKDLLILLGSWGPCEDCPPCPADLDGSGVVGVSDLLILLGNWG